MNKLKLIAAVSLAMISLSLSAQDIILNFSGMDNTQPLTPDHIWIHNVTRGCDTSLAQGNLSIDLGQMGISEQELAGISQVTVISVSPNPVRDHAETRVYLPVAGNLDAAVTGIDGRDYGAVHVRAGRGIHRFDLAPGKPGIFILTFRSDGKISSVKVESTVEASSGLILKYNGLETPAPGNLKSGLSKGFIFTPGDQIMVVGYSGSRQSGIVTYPTTGQDIVLQFATGIPCPGLATVTYEGTIYHTVQIAGQCWLKENLNIGARINASADQQDNGVIEKYCFNDDEANCGIYGGLYQWEEMMKYFNHEYNQAIQGICPGDWHLPSSAEWTILEGTVDSQHGINDPVWWNDGARGLDAGKNLKTTSGWENSGNGTDLYGFSALPGGNHEKDTDVFLGMGRYGMFWTATESASVFAATHRNIIYLDNRTYRDDSDRTDARSVRCVKN